MNRNLVGSTYGRFCIKFPQSRMKGERHRLSPLSLLFKLSPDGSVCHQFELQTGDICLSNPKPESLGSGCNGHLLERNVQLHLPTILSSPQDSTQDKRGWLQDHSYSSGLVKTILVPGSPTIIVCKTASSSLERRPFVSIQGKEASSRPGETPSACMVAVRMSISASLEQLDSQQGQYMTQNGQSFVLGVCQNKLILSVSLLSN
jgi:hypothetical protein